MSDATKVAFVLASTAHGTMILNHLDEQTVQGRTFGVGYETLRDSGYEWNECNVLSRLLEARRQHFGDGVIAVDAGANIGTHTISLARLMTGWGEVIAIEPQERIYYALCGNIAINNVFNASAVHAALGDQNSTIRVPIVDYQRHASFGSLELDSSRQDIGQSLEAEKCIQIYMHTLDSYDFQRLDLIKLDIEGMELKALAGAHQTITDFLPIIFVEVLKQNVDEVKKTLELYGYEYGPIGRNLIAIHKDDPTLKSIPRIKD